MGGGGGEASPRRWGEGGDGRNKNKRDTERGGRKKQRKAECGTGTQASGVTEGAVQSAQVQDLR